MLKARQHSILAKNMLMICLFYVSKFTKNNLTKNDRGVMRTLSNI